MTIPDVVLPGSSKDFMVKVTIGLVTGEYFNPKEKVSRAEFASLLKGMIEKLVK